MEIEEPRFNQMAFEETQKVYPLLDNRPILKEIFDVVIFSKLAARLAFGEPTRGDVFSKDYADDDYQL